MRRIFIIILPLLFVSEVVAQITPITKFRQLQQVDTAFTALQWLRLFKYSDTTKVWADIEGAPFNVKLRFRVRDDGKANRNIFSEIAAVNSGGDSTKAYVQVQGAGVVRIGARLPSGSLGSLFDAQEIYRDSTIWYTGGIRRMKLDAVGALTVGFTSTDHTATAGSILASNEIASISAATNASLLAIHHSGAITAGRTGTGVFNNIKFNVGGLTRMTLTTAGFLRVGDAGLPDSTITIAGGLRVGGGALINSGTLTLGDGLVTAGTLILREPSEIQSFGVSLTPTSLSANRTLTLPDATGTIALTSNINYPVTSVFGRTGAVTAQANDYTWAQINKTVSSLADITTRSASDLSSGTLADARLSSNVPLKNAANTFTNTQRIEHAGGIVIGNSSIVGKVVLFDVAGGETGTLRPISSGLSASQTWSLPNLTGTILLGGSYGTLTAFSPAMYIVDISATPLQQVKKRTLLINGVTVTLVVID